MNKQETLKFAQKIIDLSSQENNDGEEYDLLQQAGQIIVDLQKKVDVMFHNDTHIHKLKTVWDGHNNVDVCYKCGKLL